MNNEKWKVGNHPSTIVSDTKVQNTNFPTPPNKTESDDADVEHYGGYLVCESIGNHQHANLIAAAPELLQQLKMMFDKFQSQMWSDKKQEVLAVIAKAEGI